MIFYPKINFSRDEIDSTFILIKKKINRNKNISRKRRFVEVDRFPKIP